MNTNMAEPVLNSNDIENPSHKSSSETIVVEHIAVNNEETAINPEIPTIVTDIPVETTVEQPLLGVSEKKPWYKVNVLEYFFRAGSIRGGIFNLCSATMGAGVLSLPSAFEMGGYGNCMVLLVIGCIVTIFTIELLIQARKASGYSTFEEMSYRLFGKWMQYIIYVGILFFCIGCAIGYIIAVKDIFENIISFNILPEFLANKYILTTIFWFFLVLPLSLLKKIDNLRFSSFLGLVCILYTVVTIIILASTDFDVEQFKSLNIFKFDVGLIKAIPLMLFAFSSQVNAFEIQSELEGDHDKKMRTVNYSALPLACIVYIVDGFAGYVKYGGNIKGNILLNMIDTPYAYVIVTFFLMVCDITFAFPMNIFPARFTILTMIWGQEEASNKENTFKVLFRHYSISFLLAASILVCGLLIDDLSIVFSFIGSLASTIVCFAFPAMACLKLNKDGQLEMSLTLKIASWALFIGSLLVGIVSLVTLFM